MTKLKTQYRAKSALPASQNLFAAKNSAKSESTFQQSLALFLLGGVLRFSIGALPDRFQGPVTKPDKVKGMTLRGHFE